MTNLEIVPAGLKRRLGWSGFHHYVATAIAAEFHLRRPRDRELIRQLTFVRVAQEDRTELFAKCQAALAQAAGLERSAPEEERGEVVNG